MVRDNRALSRRAETTFLLRSFFVFVPQTPGGAHPRSFASRHRPRRPVGLASPAARFISPVCKLSLLLDYPTPGSFHRPFPRPPQAPLLDCLPRTVAACADLRLHAIGRALRGRPFACRRRLAMPRPPFPGPLPRKVTLCRRR